MDRSQTVLSMMDKQLAILWRRLEKLENEMESLAIHAQERFERYEGQIKKLFALMRDYQS